MDVCVLLSDGELMMQLVTRIYALFSLVALPMVITKKLIRTTPANAIVGSAILLITLSNLRMIIIVLLLHQLLPVVIRTG